MEVEQVGKFLQTHKMKKRTSLVSNSLAEKKKVIFQQVI